MTKESEDMDPVSLGVSAITNEKSGLLGKIYEDLAQPGVQKVGKALGTVLDLSNVLMTPVWMLTEYVGVKRAVFQRNMKVLKDEIDKIPEEKVCEVPPEIGVPIVEKLTYTTNGDIRSAYINLLSKAASEDTAAQAHPAFTKIIETLSADEAKIIKYLKNKNNINFLSYDYAMKCGGYSTVTKFATGIEHDISLNFPGNMEVYINNLLTNGILSHTPGIKKTDQTQYDDLLAKYKYFEDKLLKEIEIHNFNLANASELEQDRLTIERYEVEKEFMSITPFGRLFIDACTIA